MNTTKASVVSGAAYMVALAAVILVGAVAFREVYAAPRPLPGTEFAPIYRAFLMASGLFLALYLGSWAGWLGVVHRRWWLGAAGLGLGAGLTAAALSALPWVLFPFDQYAAGAAWVFFGLPLGLGVWAVVTAAGEIRRRAS